jgi:hypothetical protein
MSKAYIKNQKDPGGSKWICAQDEEDFEQEKLIKQWLEREGRVEQIDYRHINSKGHARNTLVKASISLDQKVSDEADGARFGDLIAGSDGRDLECGGELPEPEREAEEIIHGYLFALGFNQGEVECLVKILKSSIKVKQSLCEKSATDLESWKPFSRFST